MEGLACYAEESELHSEGTGEPLKGFSFVVVVFN